MTEDITGKKWTATEPKEVSDILAVEEMLSISINGDPYTITMRTPGNEKALVRGILLTENIFTAHTPQPNFIVTNKNHLGYITEVNVVIEKEQLKDGIETKRNLLSVTSCGMCGVQAVDLYLGRPLPSQDKLAASQVAKMFDEMKNAQGIFRQSGGSHAAAAFDLDGKLLSIQEDIGRHNAVDKVIGDLLLQNILPKAKVLLVSGRLSYEIIRKAYRASIPFVAAVSAPSSMAVRTAEESGICLLAFCRGNQFTAYTHPDRIF